MKAGSVTIRNVPTGVPGLDEILAGGLPEFSFNLVAGEPGAGKTTLTQQIVFANATVERPALYFTLLGEPTLKLLRYQQQMSFFDRGRVGSAVQFINLSEEVLRGDLGLVLDRIAAEVERARPGVVVVDSFRTVTGGSQEGRADPALERFIQGLALKLTSWEVTSFLVGEYQESELRNPVFTVADGVFWMSQSVDQNSVVRKIRVVKMRGRASMPGLHTMRLTSDGVQVFPRTVIRAPAVEVRRPRHRLSTGIAGLDDMMGGGVPAGDAVVLVGPTGSGKTAFATRFAAAGQEAGEASVIVVFEEHPRDYVARARLLGLDLEAMQASGLVRLVYLRPLDLSPDEVLHEVRTQAREISAQRVIIDSLSGFRTALAPTFRADFRESLYRLVAALTAEGTTVWMTLEMESDRPLAFTPPEVAFLCDDIIVQRQVEVQGRLRNVLAVVKMRGSAHSHEIREYRISEEGVRMLTTTPEFEGAFTGRTRLRSANRTLPGLTRQEHAVLRALEEEIALTQVVAATGLEAAVAEAALRRLVTLGYAIERTPADGAPHLFRGAASART
ncbi:MAG: ATPase domain-containing protein [Pseudomonadota bacterium]|nr:ATPase domain-containing protein [Pseudomonadota bacterium]